jgi:plasmid maintenance system antidote protein VapI
LARYFETIRDFWMKMPMLYDLALASREAPAPSEIKIFPALGAKKEN